MLIVTKYMPATDTRGSKMYSVNVHGMTKYFVTYSSAKAYIKAIGMPKAKINSVH